MEECMTKRRTAGSVVIDLADEVNSLAEDVEKMVSERLGKILIDTNSPLPNGPVTERERLPEYFDALRNQLEGIKLSLHGIRQTINRVDL